MGACQSSARATAAVEDNFVTTTTKGRNEGRNSTSVTRRIVADSDRLENNGDVTASSSSSSSRCPEDGSSRQNNRPSGGGDRDSGRRSMEPHPENASSHDDARDRSTIPASPSDVESPSSLSWAEEVLEIEPQEGLTFHLSDAGNRTQTDDDDSTTEARGECCDKDQDSNSSTEQDLSQPATADMILRHPGGRITSCIVFKIKTTKPDRYLVSPKLGMISPGTAMSIRLRILDQDKEEIIRSSRNRRRDSSSFMKKSNNSIVRFPRDRFMVQYFVASDRSKRAYERSPSYQTLTKIWDGVRDVDDNCYQGGSGRWSFKSLASDWGSLNKGGGGGGGSTSSFREENARLHRHKLVVRHVIEDADLPLDVTIPPPVKTKSNARINDSDMELVADEHVESRDNDDSGDRTPVSSAADPFPVIRNAKSLFSSISDHDLVAADDDEDGNDDGVDDAGADENADRERDVDVDVVVGDDNSSDAADISRYSDAEGLKLPSLKEEGDGGSDGGSDREDDFLDAPMVRFEADDDGLPFPSLVP